MDNMYQPPPSGPQDNWPTQQFGPGGAPPGTAGRHRALRWSAGIALAALLAGGGALAATTLTSNSSPASGSAQNPGSLSLATQDPGQAAALSTILSSASAPDAGTPAGSSGVTAAAGPASGAPAGSGLSASFTGTPVASADAAALSPKAAPAVVRTFAARCRRAARMLRAHGRRRAARVVLRACRVRRLIRLRALGGLHGQFTIKTKSGIATIGFARGVIESVTSSDIVIKSADNSLWTWDLVSTTVVRQSGRRVSTSALKSGEQVFAGGPEVSGANNARLIVIRPASPASSAAG